MTDKMWKHIYNSVFTFFMPPKQFIEKIIYDDGIINKEFKNTTEMMAYFALNIDKEIDQKSILFELKKDVKIYEEGQQLYKKVVKMIKGEK